MLYTISMCLKNKTRALLIALTVVLGMALAGCATAKKSGIAATPTSTTGERVITGVTATDEAGIVKIRIKGSSPLRYTSVKQASPLGILLYFPETKLEKGDADYPQESRILGTIKATQQNHTTGFDTRIRILLNKDMDYDVTKETDGLVLTLSNLGNDSDGKTADEKSIKTDTDKKAEAKIDIDKKAESAVLSENSGSEKKDAGITVEEIPVNPADIKKDTTVSKGSDALTELKKTEREPDIVRSSKENNTLGSAANKKATKLTSVEKISKDGRIDIEVKANGSIDDYKLFTIPGKGNQSARVVCDIFKLKGMNIKGEKKVAVNSNGVKMVRYRCYPDKTRIVIDTTNENLSLYKANFTDNTLVIGMDPLALASLAKPAAVEENIKKEVDVLSPPVVVEKSEAVVKSDIPVNDGTAKNENAPVAEKTVAMEKPAAEKTDDAEKKAITNTVPVAVPDNVSAPVTQDKVTESKEKEDPKVSSVEKSAPEIKKEEIAVVTEKKKEPEKAAIEPVEVKHETASLEESSKTAESSFDKSPVAAKLIADASTEAPPASVTPPPVEEKPKADEKSPAEAAKDTKEVNDKPAADKTDTSSDKKAESADTKKSEEAKLPEGPAADVKAKPVKAPSGNAYVSKIDFSTEKKGKSSITIGTSEPVTYKITKKNKKTLHLRLFTVKLPKNRKFPFITTRFESAVNRIIPVQTSGMKDNALFIIELREAVAYNVDQQGNEIKINFEASKIKPKPENKAGMPAWKTVLSRTGEIQDIEREVAVKEGRPYGPKKSSKDISAKDEVEILGGKSNFAGGDKKKGGKKDQLAAGMDSESAESSDVAPDSSYKSISGDGAFVSWAHKKKYTGEKIAVDFYDTDIKNVFRIIRAVSGQNFAIDKDVEGKVTMTLDKPVPWDQVLDLVLKMNLLGMVSEGGINRIATLETLKQEEEKRLEYIAAEEKTKAKKRALEPLSTEYIMINYSNADKEIVPHIEKLLTPERGKVSVDVRTNQVILTDTKEKIKIAKSLIKRLDKITRQVIIEARIVEATTSFSRSLGSSWGVNTNPNFDSYVSALGGTYGYKVAIDNSVAATSSIGVNFTKLTGGQFLLNAKLMAMESKGEGKIVSAPKVLTMDNKEATITQGVEIPFATVSSSGTQTTFKSIALKLAVTPHVTSDSKISMKVVIDKNDVGGVTNLGPTITTKKVESELLISDGDTIVIGGIIKSNKSITDSGIPLVSELPIIGWLFKSRIESEDKQELLVFLSPRIVGYEETER